MVLSSDNSRLGKFKRSGNDIGGDESWELRSMRKLERSSCPPNREEPKRSSRTKLGKENTEVSEATEGHRGSAHRL